MRRLAILSLLALVPAAVADDAEAEKLFRAMEKKVRAARDLHFVFDGVTAVDGAKIPYRGSLDRADGTKYRFVLEGINRERRVSLCDGKGTYSNLGREVTLPTAGEEVDLEKALGLFARAGISYFSNAVRTGPPKAKEVDLDAVLQAGDFKLGARENVDGHDAQAIEYTLRFSTATIKATVWIDSATELPLRHSVTTKAATRDPLTDVQNFSAFTLGAKADPKLFALPSK